MALTFESWPFELPSWENEERWWKTCHVPGEAETVLQGNMNWAAIIGGPASGKSTVLGYLKRLAFEEGSFVLDYSPERWPDAKQTHVEKIMGLAFQTLCEQVVERPDQIDQWSETQRMFIRWVLETLVNRFAYSDWLDSLPKAYDDQLRKIDASILVNDSELRTNVSRQITQLVSISRRIGYNQVKVFVDIPPYLSATQEAGLEAFYQELDIKHKSGFYCISALPKEIFEQENIKSRVRGRVYLREIEVTKERTDEIVNRHLSIATREVVCTLDQLATPELLEKINSFINDEFGGPAPGAWLSMTRLLLEHAAVHGLPCPDSCFEPINVLFYERFLPLRVLPEASHMGVWRGHKFIQMEEGPYDFVKSLWKNKGRPVDFEKLSATKGNTHTLASRARGKIEPGFGQHIYIVNRKNEGYWLEHYI